MQTKILTAAVAAFSFSSVQAAVLPRADVSLGYVALPSFQINPNDAQVVVRIASATVNLALDSVVKIAGIVDQASKTTGATAGERLAEINQAVASAASAAGGLLTQVDQLATRVKNSVPSPSAPSPAVPSVKPPVSAEDIAAIGKAAEDLVRQVQVLAREVTTQIDNVLAQVNDTATGAIKAAAAEAEANLRALLFNVGTTANTVLGNVAAISANIKALTDRVRNAQVKLNPVVNVGAQPDVEF